MDVVVYALALPLGMLLIAAGLLDIYNRGWNRGFSEGFKQGRQVKR